MSSSIVKKAMQLQAVAAAEAALRHVCVALPYLSGLTRNVHLLATSKVSTACVGPSGLIVVNPAWFLGLNREDAMFVMAHELLHLAFRHHDRTDESADRALLNEAKDYVINDMLITELRLEKPPVGGRYRPGARTMSMERIAAEMLGNHMSRSPGKRPSTRRVSTAVPSVIKEALIRSGLAEEPGEMNQSLVDDLISEEDELIYCPDWSPDLQKRLQAAIGSLCVQATALAAVEKRIQIFTGDGAAATESDDVDCYENVVKTKYCPRWECALQRWIESVAPGSRTYSRPSRRGADRIDVVLPGRNREGWTLNIILDTSWPMWDSFPEPLPPSRPPESVAAGAESPSSQRTFHAPWRFLERKYWRLPGWRSRRVKEFKPIRVPRDRPRRNVSGSVTSTRRWHPRMQSSILSEVLGAIASFCRSAGISEIRILRCDPVVHVKECVSPEQLSEYEIEGIGSDDISFAMDFLAQDSEVTAAIVITAGRISYPASAMPYNVLWVSAGLYPFDPPYGQVIPLRPGHMEPW